MTIQEGSQGIGAAHHRRRKKGGKKGGDDAVDEEPMPEFTLFPLWMTVLRRYAMKWRPRLIEVVMYGVVIGIVAVSVRPTLAHHHHRCL